MSLRITARLRKLEISDATAEASTDPKGFLKGIRVDIGVRSPEADDVLEDAIGRAERGCYVRAAVSDDVVFDVNWHRLP